MEKILLDNGVTIIILKDEYLENDFIIKFRNYGSIIDSVVGISGFQHLLEHSFFFNNDNYNFATNASTTFSDMCLELNIHSKNIIENNESINILKSWLFKNNDYTKLNFSRDLTINEISKYIDELDNEFFFRQNMNIPWDLQNFFLTNQKNHYFGGNRQTFFGREEEIKKWLSNPYPIENKDIFIFLKQSVRHFLNPIKNIFSQLSTNNNTETPMLSYNKKNWFNKVIKINDANTCDLIFLLSKKIVNKKELVYLSMLFNNFTFTDISYMSDYYCSFTFSDINEIVNFLKISTNPSVFYLNTFSRRDLLSINLLYGEKFDIIDSLDFKIMNSGISKETFFEKNKNIFLNLSTLFSKASQNKEYIISNKMDNFIKYNTFANEPYDIDIIKFNYDIFFNQNVTNFFDNPIFQKNSHKCFNNLYKVIDFSDSTKNMNELTVEINNSKKTHINFYFNALITFYSTSNNQCFEDVVKLLKSERKINNIIDCVNNSKFSNTIYEIKTDYNFFFGAFVIPKNKENEIRGMKINLTHKLKREGLLYHLDSYCVKYENKNILYYFSGCRPEDVKKIFNTIQTSFITNGMPAVYNFVISQKSMFNDFSKLKKKILVRS